MGDNKMMERPSRAVGAEGAVEGREFRKRGCGLTEFPVIKLHIFSGIEVLDLSDNIISDLSPLEPHSGTASHVLARLRTVNLARNQFPNADALLPLARAARGLLSLDLTSNPLVNNLNFLYEIALAFEKVEMIMCGFEVRVGEKVREVVARQQLTGGRVMEDFLKGCERTTERLKVGLRLPGEKEFLEGLFQDLQQPLKEVPQQNDLLFAVMARFTSFAPGSPSPTYRSPQRRSRQIEVRSQYQLGSEGDWPEERRLGEFYEGEVVQRQSISGKLLQEIEVEEEELLEIEEGRKAIPPQQLLQEARNKWTRNLALTPHAQCLTPFRSVQTQATLGYSPLEQEGIYFGFDRDWTHETLQFLRHRLLSLLRMTEKTAVAWQPEVKEGKAEAQTFQSEFSFPLPLQPSPFSVHQNYQTFGTLAFDSPLPGNTLPSPKSPKSRNKFIIGSLVNVLQLILKRIVMRRIRDARPIRTPHLHYLDQVLQSVARRAQQTCFRRIYEAAIFYRCLQQKMEQFRKRQVFRAWRQVGKRRAKLLKTLLLRKVRKENALLSVFLTQMRLNCSTVGLERKIMRSKQQLLKPHALEDLSCILRRSATSQKLPLQGREKRDCERTLPSRKNLPVLPRRAK